MDPKSVDVTDIGVRRYDEPTLTAEVVFDGHVIRVEEHTVRLPNGNTATRELVFHPGAVAIVAELPGERLVLVEQFRKGPRKQLLELPAGKLNAGEDPAACAHRELAEETGYEAQTMEQVYAFYTSPGFADERITLFYANGLRPGLVHPDEDEFVSVRTIGRDQLQQALDAGEVDDAKTLIGVLWWLQRPNRSPAGKRR